MKDAWELNRINACKPLEGGQKLRRYGAKVDLSTWKEEKNYADFYNEGRVLGLQAFLQEQGYNPRQIGNQEQQRAFIEQVGWSSISMRDPHAACTHS